MTTIATFTKTETGYIGEIHTLALKSTLTLSPADNTKGKAPDFRVIAEDGIEIGGGLGPVAGKVWRIGTMGHTARLRNVTTLLAALSDIVD